MSIRCATRRITFPLATKLLRAGLTARMWNEPAAPFGMDTLVATGAAGLFRQPVRTSGGTPHGSMRSDVRAFLLIARQIEVVARATDHVDTLARAPAFAWREDGDGCAAQVPVATLSPYDGAGAAGRSVPADGLALAAAAVDESLLTGEAEPVSRAAGEELRAGSIVVGSVARLRVTRTGQDTWLSQLSRLIERAQNERPAAARLADAVATRFVLALFAAAALTCLWWLKHDPSRAFEVTLAVLVVACPCALSLAIPPPSPPRWRGSACWRASGRARRQRVDTVVFDGTGTLSLGGRACARWRPSVAPAPGRCASRGRWSATAGIRWRACLSGNRRRTRARPAPSSRCRPGARLILLLKAGWIPAGTGTTVRKP